LSSATCLSPRPRVPGIANGSVPTGCSTSNRGPDRSKHRSSHDSAAVSAAAVGVTPTCVPAVSRGCSSPPIVG
jgi:hypothetical protein